MIMVRSWEGRIKHYKCMKGFYENENDKGQTF